MLSAKIEKYDSSIEGTGLVAKQFISANTIVWRFDTTCIELSNKELLTLPKKQRDLTYQKGNRYILEVDGGQFMNHSCDPNVWWQGDDTMSARRDIMPGEEITYDYATSEANLRWRPEWDCRCGTNQCRGIITGMDCLSKEFQERYRDHMPTWVENFIEKHHGFSGWLRRLAYRFTVNPRRWIY